MNTYTIASMKGGSGKSTTAFNLAAGLAAKGKHVLLIDLDPQANLTAWAQVEPPGQLPIDVLAGSRPLTDLVTPTQIENLSICPASDSLIFAPEELAPIKQPDMQLLKKIEAYRKMGQGSTLDYVFIDTPPGFGILTRSALAAAAAVIIPTATQYLNITGLVSFMQTLEKVRAHMNPSLQIAGILLTRVDRRTRHALEVVDLVRKHYGKDVFKTEIRENVRLAESVSFGKPIFTYDRSSYGAADYAALTAEILRKEKRRL